MIGVKAVPPMPPRLEMVKQPPCISAAASLPRARLLAERRELARELEHVLAVGVADHRHDESVRRVGREADVQVLLEHQLARLRVERGAEVRKLLQRLHAGAHDEGERRELDAARRRLVLERGARRLELGDVGLVELRDVRHVDPAACSRGPEIFWMRVERSPLDRAERREIDGRHARQRRTGGRRGAAGEQPA